MTLSVMRVYSYVANWLWIKKKKIEENPTNVLYNIIELNLSLPWKKFRGF